MLLTAAKVGVPESVARDWHRDMEASGWACLLIAREGGTLLERARAEDVQARGLPLRGEFDLPSALRLRRIVRESGASILHCHTAHALGLALWATLGLRRKPAVVASRRVSFPLRSPASLWKYRRADAVVAVCEEVRESLVAQGLDPGKVWTIQSGVDLSRFDRLSTREEARDRFALPKDALVVGAVGALVEHKGQRDLLDALAGLRSRGLDVVAAFAGEGPLREDLTGRARRLGVPLKLLGYVEEPAELYPALDALVLSSRSGEGSPGVIKEAAAAGIPVVATAVSGTSEILRDGEEALLVPAAAPERLETALGRLFGEPELVRTLSRAAKARVEHFSMDEMARKHADLYRRLLSGSGPFSG